MKDEQKENQKEYILAAAKKTMENRAMSDKSVDAAISDFRKKRQQEIEDNQEENPLALAQAVMKENKKRKKKNQKILRISMTSIMGTLATIVILFSVLFYGLPRTNDEYAWKSHLSIAQVDYAMLEKTDISSIKAYNQENKVHFYYLENMDIKNSYLLCNKNKRIILAEDYSYEGIPCSLYIVNSNTEIRGIDIQLEFVQYYIFEDISFSVNQYENDLFISFQRDYQYYIKLSSSNFSLVESILSTLTQK